MQLEIASSFKLLIMGISNSAMDIYISSTYPHACISDFKYIRTGITL